MTTTFHHIESLRDALQSQRVKKRIALVPTMGNLHDGHLSLVKLAQEHADVVVVSIFVNPTQFGENEDFDSYPRTLEKDMSKLTEAGADYVFAPSVEEMYAKLPVDTKISMGAIAEQLCGQSRSTHFDGVAIVVSKLFNIVQPDVAIFGKKDYQQLAIIRQLVQDLSYPIKIIGGEIVRAEDGLALSSRNQYLTEKERQTAPLLHEEIQKLASHFARGEHLIVGTSALIKKTVQTLTAAGFEIDYLKIRTQQLQPIENQDKQLIILVAAWLGRTRLLDNQEITVL